jgi:hypothetical protein
MFALIKQDGTIYSLTDGTQPIQWDDMSLPPPRLMSPGDRLAHNIFDFVQAPPTPEFHDAGGTTYSVDQVMGIVTESVAVTAWDSAKMWGHRREEVSRAIQTMLDEKAKSLRYDSILSARSYAGYVNPFQAEALRLADWSASCWEVAGVIEAEVMAGALLPTVDEVLALMPVY